MLLFRLESHFNVDLNDFTKEASYNHTQITLKFDFAFSLVAVKTPVVSI